MPFTDLIDLPAAPLQRGNLGPSANSETRSRARNRYSAAMEIRSGGISVAFFRVAAQRRSTRRRASARHFDHGWKCTPAGMFTARGKIRQTRLQAHLYFIDTLSAAPADVPWRLNYRYASPAEELARYVHFSIKRLYRPDKYY